MLDSFKDWLSGAEGHAVPLGLSGCKGAEERRLSERFWFAGAEIYLFLPSRERYRLWLRDLCCQGASGLTDAPLSPGELVMLQLDETLVPAANVTWTRNSCVGLTMINPLPTARLRRLAERHHAGKAWSPAMRSSPDLHAW